MKQREAERRRLQKAEKIPQLYTSPNIDFTEIITEPIIDQMSTKSRSVAGLGEMQNVVVELSQQKLRSQSSANITEIPKNYSQFRYYKSAHEYFNYDFKKMNLDMLAQLLIDFGFKKDLKKPAASGNLINAIISVQNADALKI